jgi:hypothetical protein
MDSEVVLEDDIMKGKIKGKLEDLKKEMKDLRISREKMITLVDNYETRIIQIEGALITLSDLLKGDQEKEIIKEEVDGSSRT